MPMPLADDAGYKWVYIGDSITPNGMIKKVEVSSHILNPNYIGEDTVLKSISHINAVRTDGDSYYFLPDTLLFLSDFSLSIGDSAYTPMRNASHYFWWGQNACAWHYISKKGVVTEVGNELADSITFRYYKLQYEDPNGNSFEKKYTERTLSLDIAMSPHIVYSVDSVCSFNAIVEHNSDYFLDCYFDNSTPPEDQCTDELECFEHLSQELHHADSQIQLFPNPFHQEIQIYNGNMEEVQLKVIDLSGKLLYIHSNLSPYSYTTIPLTQLNPGIYVARIMYKNGDVQPLKIIKTN